MTTVMNTGSEWEELREKLRREITVGGELVDLPCPRCGLPRCQRSSYIRCSKCGMNWDIGSDYSRHPTLSTTPKKADPTASLELGGYDSLARRHPNTGRSST